MNHAHHTDDIMVPAAVLKRAADYLTSHGWHQCAPYDRDFVSPQAFPPADAIGAIIAAVTGRAIDDVSEFDSVNIGPAAEATFVLAEFLGLDLDDFPDHWFVSSVNDWNDEAQRTAVEVVTTLHAAANEWTTRTAGGTS